MRCQTSHYTFEHAPGGKISKERFESEGAATYESGVYLEDPIEMSMMVRTR